MFFRLNEEIRNIQNTNAMKNAYITILLFYPSIQIRIIYKISCFFKKIHLSFIAYFLMMIGKVLTGIEINLGAKLGKRVFIDHGSGTVIGQTSIIGNDVLIYHGVTLGATKSISGRRHPKIGNNVTIGAGAKVLGAINIGDNVIIGANAVVTKDVPNNTVVGGIPAKVIRKLEPLESDKDEILKK